MHMATRDDDPEVRTGKPAGAPRSVADALSEVLAAHDLDLAAPSAVIGERWESIVGSEIALHCRPVGIKAGVLHADVDSSVWCQQLQLRTPEILAALRENIGARAPTDLRFRVGYALASSAQPSRTEPANEREPRE